MYLFSLFPLEVWGTFKINGAFIKDLWNSSSAVYAYYKTEIENQVSTIYYVRIIFLTTSSDAFQFITCFLSSCLDPQNCILSIFYMCAYLYRGVTCMGAVCTCGRQRKNSLKCLFFSFFPLSLSSPTLLFPLLDRGFSGLGLINSAGLSSKSV